MEPERGASWRRCWITKLVLTVMCLGASCVVATAEEGALRERDAITLRMVQLARAGRVEEARENLRAYLADHATDGTMFYNLACLDLLLDEPEQALADLAAALTGGYTNFRLIDVDRSLDPLRDDPASRNSSRVTRRSCATPSRRGR